MLTLVVLVEIISNSFHHYFSLDAGFRKVPTLYGFGEFENLTLTLN